MLDTYVAAIIDRAEALLAERDGALNKKQREVLKTIIASAERFFLSYAHRSALAPGEFFFKMRFETSTALTPIRGYSDLLLMEVMGPLNARQREHIESIAHSARSVRDTVDALVSTILVSSEIGA